MTIEILATFVMASAALSLAPGPDNLFVLMQSSLYGKRSGVLVTLGLCTGLLFHTAAVCFGLAAIVQSSETLFFAIKVAGAAYLLYLAFLAFKAQAGEDEVTSQPNIRGWALYFRGLVMNITNPKVAIFFLAFFPQFIPLNTESPEKHIFLLGSVFIVVALIIFVSISILADRLRSNFLASKKSQTWVNRLAGCVFLGLAVKLIISGREFA